MALLLAGAAEAADPTVSRVAGETRYDTAAAAAAEGFGTSDTVVLVNGEAFPDGLSAAYLAGLHKAPILLTGRRSMPAATARALSSLRPRNVIVVGGSAAVSPSQTSALAAAGRAVTRISGADRYATAAAVARSAGTSGLHVDRSGKRTAFLATGLDFADALSAAPIVSAVHAPIVFTAGPSLPAETLSTVKALDVDRLVVLGGDKAVSPSVVRQLGTLPGVVIDRVAGPNRFATATALADLATSEFGFSRKVVGVVNGISFADGLAAGPSLGNIYAPMLLTGSGSGLRSETRDYLAAHGEAVGLVKAFGGRNVVAPLVLSTIRDVVRAASVPSKTPPPQEPPALPPLDSTPPAVPTLSSPTAVSSPDYTLAGGTEAGSTVTVAVNGGTAVPATVTADTYLRDITLTGPTNTVVVTATDASGNTSSQTFTITLDAAYNHLDSDPRDLSAPVSVIGAAPTDLTSTTSPYDEVHVHGKGAPGGYAYVYAPDGQTLSFGEIDPSGSSSIQIGDLHRPAPATVHVAQAGPGEVPGVDVPVSAP